MRPQKDAKNCGSENWDRKLNSKILAPMPYPIHNDESDHLERDKIENSARPGELGLSRTPRPSICHDESDHREREKRNRTHLEVDPARSTG